MFFGCNRKHKKMVTKTQKPFCNGTTTLNDLSSSKTQIKTRQSCTKKIDQLLVRQVLFGRRAW